MLQTFIRGPHRAILGAFLLLGLAALSAPAHAQSPSRATEVESRVEALLARMTLDEKVGQLNLTPNNPAFDIAEIRNGHVGGVLAFTEAPAITAAQTAARESRLGIPLLVGLDVLHGLRTMFPLALAESASFDPALARATAEAAAREAKAVGFNWTFAPMADLARDPRWGRIIEGFGEDPLLGRLFTAARVEGFRAGGLATTLKHFVGYGAATGGRDYDATEIPRRDLFDSYLPPFRAGILAGAESVMSAFTTLNGIPATASRNLLTGILRERWGWDGFVVSDWWAIVQLVDHGVAASPAEAAMKAILAGVDMDMADGLYRAHLARAVRDGLVPETVVTEAARRVLRAKFRMGLFEQPPPALVDSPVPSEASRALSRRAAQDTMVLLRNVGSLPLQPASGRRIALVGGLAETPRALVGPHEALAIWADGISARQGLADRAGRSGATLAFSPGCDAACGTRDGFEAAIETAKGADLVIAVLGETEEITGEGGSRAHLTLPGLQAELLARLVETGKPVVLVLVAGRPIELGPIVDRLGAVLMAWFPGTEGGHALADILFGDAEPSAKLPVSWPRTVGQVPIRYDRLPTGRPPEAGNRYTLRYSDETLAPLFPFGFGLGYTSFALSDLLVTTPSITKSGVLDVKVRITNTGARAGREVVQLYVRQPVASVSRPLRQLKAFEKVALSPGESRIVSLRVPAAELGYHDDDGSYVVEPGPFQVFVGSSSDATLSGAFEVTD
ncbi:glycoside hydrolase family 3 N-terminal domain-containing protein [uncultured Enterovirga sp.]|uniref:glycoside hydrolase family 3 N-terminal domain-containing protein n=1 Tax=uncultured Enterovirga sp. TaxID=2026352 RepID=UPI0035C998FD